MRRELRKVFDQRFRLFSGTLSPFSPLTKIWRVFVSSRSPIFVQVSPFRALSLSRNIPEVVVADEFCELLVKRGNAARSSLCHSSWETAHKYVNDHLRASHRLLDQAFTLTELKIALK